MQCPDPAQHAITFWLYIDEVANEASTTCDPSNSLLLLLYVRHACHLRVAHSLAGTYRLRLFVPPKENALSMVAIDVRSLLKRAKAEKATDNSCVANKTSESAAADSLRQHASQQRPLQLAQYTVTSDLQVNYDLC